LVACNGAPGDVAEWYETESTVEAGDVVMMTRNGFKAVETVVDARTGMFTDKKIEYGTPILAKSNRAYAKNILGIVSTSPYQTLGKSVIEADAKNPQPVALAGRVPVKVSLENGSIEVGDYLTASATKPGFAMKAIRSGYVIGQALESFSDSDSNKETSLIFVQTGYKIINNTFVLESDTDAQLSGEVGSISQSENSSMLVDQQGSGNILQLQKQGTDRFIVANNGSIKILAETIELAEEILTISNSNQVVISITAAGHLKVSKDTSGTALMKAGTKKVNVSFTTPYTSVPKIIATPQDLPVAFAITKKTENGFTILTLNDVPTDTYIDWFVIEQPEDTVSESEVEIIPVISSSSNVIISDQSQSPQTQSIESPIDTESEAGPGATITTEVEIKTVENPSEIIIETPVETVVEPSAVDQSLLP
jgi:hypothetical protein